MSKPKLGDLLLEAGLIDEVQLKIALEEQKERGTRFGSTLLALHFVDENVLAAFLSRQLNIACVSLNHMEIPPSVLAKVPRGLALRLHALPVKVEGERLHVALCDPMDSETLAALEEHTRMMVVPMIAPQSTIEEAIARLYPAEAPKPAGQFGGESGLFPELLREIEETEIFGRQFRQMNERLERIEQALAEIRDLLAKR
jgi:hypothetical protein